MTPANWLDLAILVASGFAGYLGWRRGAIGAALGLLGIFGGAFIGMVVARALLPHLPQGTWRLLTMLGLMIAVVAIGQAVGDRFGMRLSKLVRDHRARTLNALVGACGYAVAVPLIVWLLTASLITTAQPAVVAAFTGSRAVRAVDQAAPYWLAGLPNALASPLRESGLVDGWSAAETPRSVLSPDGSVLRLPAADLRGSVLRVRDLAAGCGVRQAGTGFVIGQERVLTNAHVVAGATEASVDTPAGPLPATVVVFDPQRDVAVLAVPGLTAPPVAIASAPLGPAADALVLGYPEGGPYTAAAARIRDREIRDVPDIYHGATAPRQIYTVNGAIRQGNSGGPLIDTDGRVLGVVFGADDSKKDIGYAMNVHQVLEQLGESWKGSTPVPTGPCQH
ncbi:MULTISPECIES: MarP family serine protease [unclassified Nocardia]|uniref:MarP family serine protease n=1 Tax=unclassified Nocardia TaxID=2637762 RepID=UPI001CE435C5|nr:MULTISPECIES: MarP family serine protease [unclassified Nocardia]